MGPGASSLDQERVDESGNLCPKLNHQHLPAEWPEWLSARCCLGCSVDSFPHYRGIQVFTYITIHTGISRDIDCHFPWDFEKRVTKV